MQQNRAFSYVEWRRETILCQQGALSIMVGRKRKRGYREPSGRAQRQPSISKLDLARQLRHRVGLSDENVIDPRAESQFGRFVLNKVITTEQYDAGLRWRGIVMAYRASIDCPSASPKSVAGAVVGGGGGGLILTDDEAHRRKSAYDEAHDTVMERVGIACMRTLNDATVHERHMENWRLVQLRMALDVLVGLAYQGRRRAG